MAQHARWLRLAETLHTKAVALTKLIEEQAEDVEDLVLRDLAANMHCEASEFISIIDSILKRKKGHD